MPKIEPELDARKSMHGNCPFSSILYKALLKSYVLKKKSHVLEPEQ